MLLRRYRRMMILSLIALGMAALTTQARASTLMVNIGGVVSGGTLVGGTTFTDNQAGVDANPALGIMDIGTFLDSISVNFDINGFTATSGNPIASIAMTSNSNLVPTVALPLSVNITITDTDFSMPPTPLSLDQTVNLLSSVGGLIAFASATGYYGDSNTEFDVDGVSTGAATSALAGGVSVNTPSDSGMIFGPTPYSLTTAIHVDILARGADPIQNLQINSNLSATTAISEPASAMLIGTGILALAFGCFWKRSRRQLTMP